MAKFVETRELELYQQQIVWRIRIVPISRAFSSEWKKATERLLSLFSCFMFKRSQLPSARHFMRKTGSPVSACHSATQRGWSDGTESRA